MVMEVLDQMMKQAVQSPEEAAQIADLEGATIELRPTGVQLNAESQPVRLYHTVTGEPRIVPRIYARTALLKRFRAKDGAGLAGEFVFSVRPTVPWILGKVKCLLHPDRPERQTYTSWGLPVCTSEHFPSEHEAENHTRSDHATAWAKIQDTQVRTRQEEDRAMQIKSMENQNAILAGLAQRIPPSQTEAAPLYVSDKPRPATRRRGKT
mgnify:CR=1 FL=1